MCYATVAEVKWMAELGSSHSVSRAASTYLTMIPNVNVAYLTLLWPLTGEADMNNLNVCVVPHGGHMASIIKLI
jgi:hypothetical protein